ncbi:unnamed protein product [Ambrosiozyma monospora]|uniref:Unnamed protein product n=1 Tax=Ambrosiozyma monospora TaxID=43982 RepID=A0ACB5TXC1_AMBMO|nr:unnamed protein product [Ambrosiozyma monospora]
MTNIRAYRNRENERGGFDKFFSSLPDRVDRVLIWVGVWMAGKVWSIRQHRQKSVNNNKRDNRESRWNRQNSTTVGRDKLDKLDRGSGTRETDRSMEQAVRVL